MNLMERMMAAGGKNSNQQVLSEATFFNNSEVIPTNLPILNIAFSGHLKGGITPGLTLMIGESKTFKSALSLYCVKSYFDKYPEAICIFYDNEYGITPKYIKSFGIDPERILHIDAIHVEQVKFDIYKRLESLKKGDKVIFLMDSLGLLASKKEVEDAVEEKSVADLSRAKAIKSLFRLITPQLNIKSVPAIMINHTYEMMNGLVPVTVNSGGKATTLSPNNIFLITKAMEKEGTDLAGWKFTINIFKSRSVREKAKMPFVVKYEGGINKWSGLLDIALESGHVIKPKNGWYQKVDMETGEVLEGSFREKQTHTKEFWEPILESPSFNTFVENKFMIANDEIFKEEDDVEDIMETLEEDE